MALDKTVFEALLTEKELPFDYTQIEGGHHLYRFKFKASQSRVLIVEVIVQETEESFGDAQIIYRHVHMMSNFNKQAAALELINELNEMKTGYYALHLAGDGEIFLRNLMRVGQDPQPLYETLVVGSGIARSLQEPLTAQLGESAPV
ncbi:hypothetical protein [Vaginisenegalia massiliensis]|uniref:hypothetical protein n=1 Tax=Vaginisenegalia massiliensis TaxID=2058294 RepID=UPI000F51BDB3|nr:hypothetical protein [Vaginisenegalia massiliensis]